MDANRARANAAQLMLTAQDRQESISVLLQELRSLESSTSKSKEASAVALETLQALKLLGRSPQGSQELGTKPALETLCAFAQLKELPSSATSSKPQSQSQAQPASRSPSQQQQQQHPSEARLEAWRILCNTLKLHSGAAAVMEEELDRAVENAVACLSTGPASLQFLASRLLFLLTVKGTEIVRTLVDRMAIIAHLHEALASYCDALDKDQPKLLTGEETMALSEMLKMLYNLTIFYPRLQTLDPKPPGAAAAAAPSTEAESPTASTSSPGSPNSTTSNGSNSNKPSSALGRGIRSVLSRSTGSASKSRPSSPKSLLTPRGLDYLTSVLVRLVLLLSHASNAPLSGSPLGSAVLCLGELPAAPAWFADTPPVPAYAAVDQSKLPSTSTTPESDVLGSLPPLAAKLLHVLDATTRHCFPGTVEPDEAKNRARLEREGRDVVDLDAELAPLLLIMRKCVIGDERGSVGATLRGRLLSNRIDRSDRLDKRSDLTGRLLRLMNSVYFSNTKVGSGELLFALCGQDSELFTSTLGYGLAAGFLASNGILGAPVGPSADADDDHPSSGTRPVNPVTGVYESEASTSSAADAMTEEEKEREAERLFVLFERLKQTGVVDVKNPVEVAQQSGRFEEVAEEEDPAAQRRHQEEQDRKEEEEAMEEMKRWKNRNAARQS